MYQRVFNMRCSPLYLVIIVFQFATLMLYEFGPIHYFQEYDRTLTYTYIILYLFSFSAGYFMLSRVFLCQKEDKYKRFLKYCLIINFVIVPVTFLVRVGHFNFDVSVGELYSLARENKDDSAFFEYIRMILSPFLFGLLPCVAWYWELLPKHTKILSVSLIVVNLFVSIFSGINQGIFLLILIISFFILLKRKKSLFKFKNIRSMMLILVALSAGLNFFVESQMTRSGSSAITGFSSKQGFYSDYNIDDGKLGVLYSALSSYLTQGYRAFELSLQTDYEFTYGVGNSTFMSRQVDRALGTNISDKTLPAKIERFGWDRYNYWSSFYLWWASDLHYIGVIVLMFAIGAVLRIVENTLVLQPNYGVVITYAYLIILLFYLSANNQLFQSGESMFGFLFFIIFCLLMKKKITNANIFKIS